jgi:ferrochelatase
MLKHLGEVRKVRNLVVVPVSFVSEHIETLEEIDMEYREVAEEHGVRHWSRVPALNTDAFFIRDMAELVEDALSSPSLSVYEATPINSNDLSDSSDGTAGASTRFGVTEAAEKINGRFAMLGILGTTLLEVVNGHPVLQMVIIAYIQIHRCVLKCRYSYRWGFDKLTP